MRSQRLLISWLCRRLTQRLAAEQGFSLIELLVTIAAGIVILAALFTIQATTLHQTTRIFSDVDSTEHARVGIEQLENELHSACITDNVTPILPGSTSSTLTFVSQYGPSPSLVPVEHVVAFNSAAETVTDTSYAETGVTLNANDSPVYTFSTTPSSSRIVLSNVTQSKDSRGNAIPMFQYFQYQQPTNPSTGAGYTAPDGNPYMMLIDGVNEVPGTSYVPAAQPDATLPLTTAEASDAAEVMISLTVGPYRETNENTNYSDVNDSVQDGVVLRLTPAANEMSDGTVFLPCQ